MLVYASDRRRRPRFPLSVPVLVGSMSGHTRDISADAVSLNVNGPVASGGRLQFTMLFLDGVDSHPHHVHCEGTIVRATSRPTGFHLVVSLESCETNMLHDASDFAHDQ